MRPAFLTLIVLAVIPAAAQNITASISGSITDPSGAVVSGADVTVVNTETNQSTAVKTSEQGVFQALYLRPWAIHVHVNAPGFKTTVRDNVRLNIEDRLRLDFVLELGEGPLPCPSRRRCRLWS